MRPMCFSMRRSHVRQVIPAMGTTCVVAAADAEPVAADGAAVDGVAEAASVAGGPGGLAAVELALLVCRAVRRREEEDIVS